MTARLKPVSLCCHAYNEADALRRLVLSSIPLADIVREWVIVDHRSSDHTPAVLDDLRAVCAEHGMALVTEREERDFQPGFLFADLRQHTYALCSAPVSWVLDADYILGPAARPLLERSVSTLTPRGSGYYGVAFSRPVIWDHLRTDENGRITDHGRVWLHAIHKGRVEILARGAARYQQVGKGGMWERAVPTGHRRNRLRVTRRRTLKGIEDVVVSANVKSADRIALRKTMTRYMAEALAGELSGPWLDEYQAGRVGEMNDYAFDDVDLRGWRTNLPNLDLRA